MPVLRVARKGNGVTHHPLWYGLGYPADNYDCIIATNQARFSVDTYRLTLSTLKIIYKHKFRAISLTIRAIFKINRQTDSQ